MIKTICQNDKTSRAFINQGRTDLKEEAKKFSINNSY